MLPAAPGFEIRDGRGTQRAHAPDRQRMSTDWPIKIRFDPHGRMLAQPAVMSKRFVYVIRNNESPPRYYAGVTSDVARRHVKHNTGNCTHTAKYRLWSIDVATTLMGHDPHGDIHTQRIAPSSEGVKVLRVITFRSQLSETSEFMLTSTTSLSWSSNTP